MPVIQPHRQIVEAGRKTFALARDDERAIRRVHVLAGVVVQRVCRLRAHLSFLARRLLRSGRGFLANLAPLEGPSVPVDRLETHEPIRRVTRDNVGQRVPIEVRQHDDADAFSRQERHHAHETVDRAAVMHAFLAAIRFDEPTQSVRRLLNLRVLKSPGND